ncbi:MAG: hypothetical protein ACHQF0_06625 [Chitinophagales bacterium]
MRLILAILLVVLFAVACSKNNFTTKPQLKIKSVNTTELSRNDDLQFTMRLTDKEGDFTTFLGYSKTVVNCPAGNFADSSLLQIPQKFLDAHLNEGDVVIDLSDVILKGDNDCTVAGGGGTPQTDTAVYSFWTKDKAGNVSDTVKSVPIIIHP